MFCIQCVPGKQLHVADALSRAYLSEATPEIPDQDMVHHVSVISRLPISAARLGQFQKETEKDQTLQVTREYIMNGWPKSSDNIDPCIKPYYIIRDNLSYVHNLILKNQRIVVPTVLRQEMKETLHTGHSGIERCKRRAKDTPYWPGINAHLDYYVASCTTSAAERKAYPHCTLPSIKPPLKTSKPATMSKTTTVHYNASARNLPVLHPGDNVRLRDGRKWSRKGTVVVTVQSPRSYHVRTEAGNVLRRNRRHRTTRYGRNVTPPQYLY